MVVGMATATLQAPPRITKRALTLAEAADQWEGARRRIEIDKALLDEAAPVLLNHFQKTGRSTYKDRIVLIIGSPKLVLDQVRVRAFLGEKLSDFQRRTEPSRSLSLLR